MKDSTPTASWHPDIAVLCFVWSCFYDASTSGSYRPISGSLRGEYYSFTRAEWKRAVGRLLRQGLIVSCRRPTPLHLLDLHNGQRSYTRYYATQTGKQLLKTQGLVND